MTLWLAFLRGWGDLLRPQIFGIVLIGMALTIGLFIGLQAAMFFAIRSLTPGSLTVPWIGAIDVGNALSWGSLALFPVMGFFLMAPVAAAFAGLYSEQVADAVEQIHYPGARGQPLDFMDGLIEALALTGIIILIAIVSLILTPFLGPFAPLLFYGLNGWLLGREFFQLAARRHLAEEPARALRQAHGVAVTVTGILIALLLTVPVVNIAVPVLAAATFTHLFHLIRATSGPGLPYRRG